jgi:hypothetical protein
MTFSIVIMTFCITIFVITCCIFYIILAEQCGYNNENHFLRQFKEKSGWTAAQFRRKKRLAKM